MDPHVPTRLVSLVGLILCLAGLSAQGDDRFDTVDVEFTAKCDGMKQRYIRMLPKGFDQESKHHLLIALHGHGSDRWQFSDGSTATGMAARNAAIKHSMILVLPDYRAKTSWMGPRAEADVCQIIEEIKRQYSIEKVIVCGGSMGGSSALTFAAMHPETVDGVAASNGTANHLEYERFQDAISASFGGSKIDIPMEYKKRSAEYWPERLTMPVGITASGRDAVVPPDSVMRLASVLKKLNRKVLVVYRPEMGHSSKLEDVQRVIGFVLDHAITVNQHDRVEHE